MRFSSLGLLTLIVTAVGCGQEPSFIDLEKGNSTSAIGQGKRDLDAKGSPDSGASDEDEIDNFGKGKGGVLGNVIGKGPTTDPNQGTTGGSTGGSNGGGVQDDDEDGGNGNHDGGTSDDDLNDDIADIDIPNADGDDLDALHKCFEKWGQVPFSGTTYVRKIKASVTVGGIGNAINDTTRTSSPSLVLVSAAVNVGGAPVYQLKNPNGYYCIKVNVNVGTNLNINLHCNARLADSKVGVNVGSVMNDDTSSIGVHVGSQISVNTIRPEGDECIR